jgi:hypothetical protein
MVNFSPWITRIEWSKIRETTEASVIMQLSSWGHGMARISGSIASNLAEQHPLGGTWQLRCTRFVYEARGAIRLKTLDFQQ